MRQNGVFKNEFIIPMFSYRVKDFEKHKSIIQQIPKRNISKIFPIGGIEDTNLDELKTAIQIMVADKDTIKGKQISFLPTSKYQSLISVLDILRTEKVHWWFMEGTIWVWWEPPAPQSTIWIKPFYTCGTGKWKHQVSERIKKEQIAQTTQEIKNINCALWPSWLLFFVMSVLAIASSVIRHKK